MQAARPDFQEHRTEQQGFLQNEDQLDGINGTQTLPAPPMPPPQPIWHHTTYTRHSMHRSELVSLKFSGSYQLCFWYSYHTNGLLAPCAASKISYHLKGLNLVAVDE